jgi:hypothetical protein
MLFARVGTVGIEGSIFQCQFFISSQNFNVMSLIKFAIDKSIAQNKTYLVGGNRVRLADVDNDSIAEKLFNAKVKGVSQVGPAVDTQVSEGAIAADQPADAAEAPPAVAKRRQS